ncbi:MAG: response regulator, partial [Candidatus Zixiibacteriota bacterium]
MSKKILTPVRTLVVDDEDIVLSLVRDALDEEPVAIDTCTTGQEALQKLEERQYELLITDIRMPKVSGIELATKARDKWPGLRVIFMTGFANLGSAKEAIQQGAVDYILKPFDLNELRKSVQKAIQIIVQDRNRVSEDKLSKLSDLGHKLFNAGDYQALGLSSLRFAMMLQQSTSGLIVCRPDADSPFVMLSLNNNYFSKQTIEQIPECQGVQLSDDIEPEFLHPRLVTSLKEHPLFRNANCETCLADAPKWLFDDTAKLVTPVTRADFFYGMIAIRADADTAEFRRSDLELLAIVANQLAGALENLQLLAASK